MHKRIPILIGLVFLIFVAWLQITSVQVVTRYITRLENIAYDIQLRARFLTEPPLKTSVVIADIDDKSLAAEGRWPWSRAKLATFLSRLQEGGAVVVAFDMNFSKKEDNIATKVLETLNQNNLNTPELAASFQKIQPFFDNDAKFAEALKQSDTELGMTFLMRPQTFGELPPPLLTLSTPEDKQLGFIKAHGYIGNLPILQAATKATGFINVFADDDGVIRRVPILIRYQDNIYPSLALEAVRLYLLSNVKLITAPYGNSIRLEGVELGSHIIPTDAHAQALIPFRGRSFTYPYFSATDVINKKIPSDALQGKIVFVGTSASGLGDIKTTAAQNVFPGVEVHATIADGILTDYFSVKPEWALGAEVFLTILLGGIFVFIFPYLGPRLITLVIIVVPIGMVMANNWLWEETGYIISIFMPIALSIFLALMNMAYGYLFETRRREHLKGMFGQYVPTKHIDEMLKSGKGSYALQGEDREMTVLFADIRSFTTISEKMTASQLKEMLNDFFTPMTEIIFKHRGTIDKYVGDLIMAFWGAPMKDKRHAQHALASALDMQKKITELKPHFVEKGWPNVEMGIGLNTGIMSVGDMGSKFRRNYTVLGDSVNLASRVESLTKYYGVKIMVTEFSEHNQDKFVFRQLDRVRVKGKEKGIGIFELVCKRTELTTALTREIESSNMALNYYFVSDWEKARQLFEKLHADYPDVKLYSLYLERISIFEKNPPPSDWDGIYTLKEK